VPDERVIQQVNGILSMNDIAFRTGDTKQNFLVPMGSAGVFITFTEQGESTIVSLRAFVLAEVDGSGERRQKILEALNEKNRQALFGCFYFDPDGGFVIVDYQLLGDHLQAPELMNALGVLASMADTLDDELREAIGSGVRAIDTWNVAMGDASDPVGAGPVVET
jgi:hypothetical protein